MDAETLKKEALEGKLSVERLVLVILELQQQNERLQQRVDELERELGQRKPEEPKPDRYSLQEQERQEKAKQKRRKKQKSLRRGRRKTKDKIVDALREEKVFPDGFSEDDCKFYRTQIIWHIEAGRAVMIKYQLYRGPAGEKPVIAGSIGRSEFGAEIFVAVGYLTYVMGLSIDKVCELLEFFWKLKLPKSQADALLNQLGSEWEPVFDDLCKLLANATVVHADETYVSIFRAQAGLGCKEDRYVAGNKASSLLQVGGGSPRLVSRSRNKVTPPDCHVLTSMISESNVNSVRHARNDCSTLTIVVRRRAPEIVLLVRLVLRLVVESRSSRSLMLFVPGTSGFSTNVNSSPCPPSNDNSLISRT